MGIPLNINQGVPAGDAANAVVTGTLTTTNTTAATGISGTFLPYGAFNISTWGTFSGNANLERTFDGGTTWIPVFVAGTIANLGTVETTSMTEVERGVGWRLNCGTLASGTIHYRFSASGLMAQSIGPN